MIGAERNLLIYEILYNFILQKIAIIEFGIKYLKNYYIFNKMVFVNSKETIDYFQLIKYLY